MIRHTNKQTEITTLYIYIYKGQVILLLIIVLHYLYLYFSPIFNFQGQPYKMSRIFLLLLVDLQHFDGFQALMTAHDLSFTLEWMRALMMVGRVD